MPEIRRCTDRLGRRVTITQGDWDRITSYRRAFSDKLAVVIQALERPDMVTQDRKGSRRQHFYRRSDLPHPFERGWIKVTIDLRRFGPRRILWQIPVKVVDVAIVSKQPHGEIRIWEPSTPGRPPM